MSASTDTEIAAVGGLGRWVRLGQAAAMDTMEWAIDFEIWNGRKPTDDELAERRDANYARRMTPGLMWPGIDFI